MFVRALKGHKNTAQRMDFSENSSGYEGLGRFAKDIQEKGEFFWIDIEGSRPDAFYESPEGKLWERTVKAMLKNQEDIATCMEILRFPAGELLADGSLFMRLPLRNAWDDDASVYLFILLSKNVLVTLHEGYLAVIEKSQQKILKEEGDESEGDTLLTLLECIIEDDINDLMMARVMVEESGDALEKDIDAVSSDRVSALKHAVGHLHSQCEDQLFSCTVLRGQIMANNKWPHLREGMTDLAETINHILRGVQRMEARLEDQERRLDAVLRTRTEQRLRLLTLISAVIMPLTLISSIYGMNFQNMPELSAEWGYYTVLGVMLVLAVGMLAFFWKRGWFK